MEKYSLDYTKLADNIENGNKLIPYEPVKNEIKKVAFDTVVFRNNPETLWKIVPGDDGNQYLAAMYSNESEPMEKNSWVVEVDRLEKNATIFYKDTPITNINLEKNKVSDVSDFRNMVPKMLQADKKLVGKMLNAVDENYRNELSKKHPELF